MKHFWKIFSSPIAQIFVAAAFLRFFLAPFFFHPDIKTIYYNSHFLSEGVWNIYDFLAKNPSQAVLGEFPYPSLTFLFHGLVYFPLRFLLGSNFTGWLGMGNDAVAIPNIFRYLFFMKVPLFFFEFGVGFLLSKMIKDEKMKRLVLLFWFFNPVNIYTIVLMGQFDIIPVFLTVLALYWAMNKNFFWAALALGFGGALKSFPLLFLPFLVIISGGNWWSKIKLALVGILPYGVFVLPFLGSVAFRQSSLVSGLSQRMFILGLDIGFEEKILLIIFALAFLFLLAAWRGDDQNSLVEYFLSLPLIILAGSHFHPQWMIWAMPFLVIILAEDRRLFLPASILVFGWLGTTFFFNDKFLTLGLISPFDPGVLFLPPPREIVKGVFQDNLPQNFFHTVFSSAAILLSFLAVSKKYVEKR